MKKVIMAIVAMTILLVTTGYAQEAQPIKLFGFFQVNYTYTPEYALANAQNSFNVQQMNIMMRKELGNNFSAFVGLQFINSFSTERMWGAMNIEEAWVKYQMSGLSLKCGILIPTFNNLNTIKNKTPILPYIIRPIVYESSMLSLVDNGDFVPEHAFVQNSGVLARGEGQLLDYAIYIGNSESDYITNGTVGATVSGNDTTTFKMIGGHVGFRKNGLRVGVSATYDREKVGVRDSTASFLSVGNVPRVRIGSDLSFKVAGFSFEGEMIFVQHTLNDLDKAGLKKIVQRTTNPISQYHAALDKKFYYFNIMYDISDMWYVYGGYSYLNDDFQTRLKDGCTFLTMGGGFRPIDQVIVKGQYVHVGAKNEDLYKLDLSNYNVAISVLF
jgi:hypothetical protein